MWQAYSLRNAPPQLTHQFRSEVSNLFEYEDLSKTLHKSTCYLNLEIILFASELFIVFMHRQICASLFSLLIKICLIG